MIVNFEIVFEISLDLMRFYLKQSWRLKIVLFLISKDIPGCSLKFDH
jgi:hypothetical protein